MPMPIRMPMPIAERDCLFARFARFPGAITLNHALQAVAIYGLPQIDLKNQLVGFCRVFGSFYHLNLYHLAADRASVYRDGRTSPASDSESEPEFSSSHS